VERSLAHSLFWAVTSGFSGQHDSHMFVYQRKLMLCVSFSVERFGLWLGFLNLLKKSAKNSQRKSQSRVIERPNYPLLWPDSRKFLFSRLLGFLLSSFSLFPHSPGLALFSARPSAFFSHDDQRRRRTHPQ
jgi:hypothetical protein